PEEVLSDIEQIAGTIDLSNLEDRIVDLAAALFDLSPPLAIALAERGAGVGVQQNGLDVLRAQLAIRLDTDAASPSALDQVQSRIADKGLRDFVRTVSPSVHRMSPSEV